MKLSFGAKHLGQTVSNKGGDCCLNCKHYESKTKKCKDSGATTKDDYWCTAHRIK